MTIHRQLLLMIVAVMSASRLPAQYARLMSVDPNGFPGNGNSGVGQYHPNDAYPPQGLCASADGGFVAFYSEAHNLVMPAAGGTAIYIRDVERGRTRLGSVDLAGHPVGAVFPELSARGRFLAFASYGSNIVSNDTNAGCDVFVRDMSTDVTERVSVSSTGGEAHGDSGWEGGTSYGPVRPSGIAISADGRFIAFSSNASDLVPNDTNLRTDVFVHDRRTGLTVLASPQDPSVPPEQSGPHFGPGAWGPKISDDGRFVGFTCDAGDLVPNDTNGGNDAFVRDLVLGTTMRVSVDSSGGQVDAGSFFTALSADGRYALFTSHATNVVGGQVVSPAAFIHDRLTGQTTLESLDAAGAPASAASLAADLSPDGRFVLFVSDASNLVPGDTNGRSDLFVRDRLLGTVRRVNVGANGIQDDQGCGGWPFFSTGRLTRNGRASVFASNATTLSRHSTGGLCNVYLSY